MDYKGKTIDELIAISLDLQKQMVKLRNERLAIKNEIASINAEKEVDRKLAGLSDVEKGILRKKLGSSSVVVTPAPARLGLKGN